MRTTAQLTGDLLLLYMTFIAHLNFPERPVIGDKLFSKGLETQHKGGAGL